MKIDTQGIENYENMTAEEKVAALEGLEIEDTATKEHYKSLIEKANREAKQYKDAMRAAENKLKEQLPEEEKKRQEEAEKYKAIAEENAQLKRDMAITQKTAFYQTLGFSEEMAAETATAFVDGDHATVEKNLFTAHQEFERNVRADVVRNTPHPQNAGAGTESWTKEKIMAVQDSSKRRQLIADHMELFTK